MTSQPSLPHHHTTTPKKPTKAPGKAPGKPGKGLIKPGPGKKAASQNPNTQNSHNGNYVNKSKPKSKWKSIDCPVKGYHKYYLNKEYIEDVIKEVVNAKFVDALHLADKRITDDGIIRLIDGIMDKNVEIKRLFFFQK